METTVPTTSNESAIVSEKHERSIKKMQITHELANKNLGHDFSDDEMKLYGEVVFGKCYWRLVGGWTQDEYAPQIEAKQKRRASILVLFHRLLKEDGERRYTTEADLQFLVDFKFSAMIMKVAAAILVNDNDPSADLYTVTESEVQEQAKN